MTKHPLSLIENSPSFTSKNLAPPLPFKLNQSKHSFKREWQAKMDRAWLLNPAQFDPHKNIAEKERVQRTKKIIEQALQNPCIKKGIDLGCGVGLFAESLHQRGLCVEALDASALPLKRLSEKGILTKVDCLPHTLLEDEKYDLVIAADVIAHLPQETFRLFFSELARIVKKEGFVVISTPLDIQSDEALPLFLQLAESEFEIKNTCFSYHRNWIYLKWLFNFPLKLIKASKEVEFKQTWLNESSPVKKKILNLLLFPSLLPFWKGLAILTHPFLTLIKTNFFLLRFLEKISFKIWKNNAISHAIFLAQKKPLLERLLEKEMEKGAKK